jgi:hypothetical protein
MMRHGHRSISEMDIRVKEWACDPQPLIEILQVSVRGLLGQATKKLQTGSHDNLLYQQQNTVIRFLVRIARGGVQGREFSKSRLIAIKRMFKQAYRELAQMMVVEKYLPDVDAVYFLTHQELGECLAAKPSAAWGKLALLRREQCTNSRGCIFRMCLWASPHHYSRIYHNCLQIKLCAAKL